MPVGPFKTFDSCVQAQRRRGKSMDSAKKICGEIEKRSQAGESTKDWRRLEFVAPITEFKRTESASEPLTITGVAINETTTRNGITYVAEELEAAAPSFRNKPILKDHNNSVDSIVGKTTENVNFNQMAGNITFEAVIVDTKMKQMISQGLVSNVSIGAMVKTIEEVETESNDGQITKQLIARGMEGVEISLVAVPGDKNATLAQAMFESFELKNQQVIVEKTGITEEKLMAEEKSAIDALREERAKLEEEIIAMQVEKLKAEKAAIEEAAKVVEAKAAEVQETAEEVVEEKTETVEEKKPIENKTRGMVKTTEEKVETYGSLGYTIERTQDSGDYAFGLSSYDAGKYSRLGRKQVM